jgi:putative cell wall-binding protein
MDSSSPATPGRRKVEDMSKEDLLAMLQKLKAFSQNETLEKKNAEEANAILMKEKDDIKEKALVLLKRCREAESKQTEYEELKTKLEAYESGSMPFSDSNYSPCIQSGSESSENGVMSNMQGHNMQLLSQIATLESKCESLQLSLEEKKIEAETSTTQNADYKFQGFFR